MTEAAWLRAFTELVSSGIPPEKARPEATVLTGYNPNTRTAVLPQTVTQTKAAPKLAPPSSTPAVTAPAIAVARTKPAPAVPATKPALKPQLGPARQLPPQASGADNPYGLPYVPASKAVAPTAVQQRIPVPPGYARTIARNIKRRGICSCRTS